VGDRMAAAEGGAGAAVLSLEEKERLAKYDLTATMAPYLDKHLVLQILDYLLVDSEFFKVRDVLKAKFEVLQKTSMVDSSIDVFQTLYPDTEVPADLQEKRDAVVAKYEELDEACSPINELLGSDEVQEVNQQGPTQLRQYLEEKHEFKSESLDMLYEQGELLFEIGYYPQAVARLYANFILSTDPARTFSALWGKFAANILVARDMGTWDAALEDLAALQGYIDKENPASALEQLQQRTWLIHWSLFVFVNTDLDQMIDLYLLKPEYANTIQTVCPHILRYVTAAVIVTEKKRTAMKDVVRLIEQESHGYRDPITDFLQCLYVDFDFDGAQKKLRECAVILRNDYFLCSIQKKFMEQARRFIFETYCRIHNTISIKMLAEKLDMNQDNAEEWVVALIRNARLDAKIDSKAGHVLMTPQVPSIYHQVIEKTKILSPATDQRMEEFSQ